MKRKEIELGDIISIPFEDNKIGICKVIWISNMMKHVIGFAVLPDFFKNDEEIIIEQSKYKSLQLPGGKFPLIYADRLSIDNGNWKIIGNLPLIDKDKELIIHNYAGNLFNGDEKIRELTTEELKNKTHHKMLVSGDILVEKLLKLMHSKQ